MVAVFRARPLTNLHRYTARSTPLWASRARAQRGASSHARLVIEAEPALPAWCRAELL
jgi:hypothetical protein